MGGREALTAAVQRHGVVLAAHGPYTAAGAGDVLGVPVPVVSKRCVVGCSCSSLGVQSLRPLAPCTRSFWFASLLFTSVNDSTMTYMQLHTRTTQLLNI